MPTDGRRDLLIAKSWLQAILIVSLIGLTLLGTLAYRTYTDEPPIPTKVADLNGRVLFTGMDVIAGQEVFLRNGLMEYGSIFGHGAYLGPDYTADYLHRAALIAIDYYGGSSSDSARQRTIGDFKANRYDPASGVLVYSAAQAAAFEKLVTHYGLLARLRRQFPVCPQRGAIAEDRIVFGATTLTNWEYYFTFLPESIGDLK